MGIGSLIWSVIVGFVIGLVARAIMPGADQMGFLATSVVGIAGSLVGGFIGGLISKPPEGATFHPAGFAMSVVGALVVLFIWQRL
ncbi:MAG TPA: GlsB/YeaQ/YmgE family stress response membrane protein [Candidatus Eisenbacteria bacterium]|nr:GlsB/YeaQ/YmgE family stress response membrane protein [Candidatus Eisenbacteria bacterium]